MEFLKWIFLGVGVVCFLPIIPIMFILGTNKKGLYLVDEKEKIPWSEKAGYFYYR